MSFNAVFIDPNKMGGLSMLLLAGEHALTAREVQQRHLIHMKITSQHKVPHLSSFADHNSI